MGFILAVRCFFTALGSGPEKVRLQKAIDNIKDPPVIKEIVREVMIPQRGAPPPREIIKEVQVEVIKEVIKEVPVEIFKEIVKEVQIETVRVMRIETVTDVIRDVEVTKEVIREMPVEIVKEVPIEIVRVLNVEVIKEVVKEVVREVPVEVIKEVVREVPVEVIKEVVREIPVEVIKEVIREVPVEVIKEVVREVPVEVIKEVVREVPVEVIKEVIREVPVEVISEVPSNSHREPPREIIKETIVHMPIETVREVVKRIPDTHGPALLLALLQQDGRLVDFLAENIDLYDDERVGAVARAIHDKCRKALFKHVVLEPLRSEKEGETVTLGADYDAAAIRVTGPGHAQNNMFGTLRHRGWKATKVDLPPRANGSDPMIVSPAEVEVE